ncbi:MAG: putative colanic acid biosynthesis acetyltransferase WcaF [Flavisolibacter sp.]|jgi:putative colanic acid biosynthesis acetyltransferase WcaF|nr:putative colanic acid biosynthesis acetyltransferase WcaF [Flavisolibacter sp.]
MKTDLSCYNNSWYKPGNAFKRFLWYVTSLIFFQNSFFLPSSFKVFLLRAFGAKVGSGVVLKPNISIKYPWNLRMENNIWIGERVWIDNLALVYIGNNVCVSQGAYLLTGNHNYSLPYFDLIVKPITLEEGVWIGAKSIVCPGVTCKSHAVLSVGSIATKDLEPYAIYQGNPSTLIKKRKIAAVPLINTFFNS